jgi:GGDEF domain-containing protein
MADTQRVLYGIRDHLNAGIPNVDGALSLVKDVLRQGSCYEETKIFHDGTLFLLEKILLPLLLSNRELEAVVHRYIQRIKKSGTLDELELEKLAAEIDAGLQEGQDNLMFPEGEPGIDLALLKKALGAMGYSAFPEGKDGSNSKSWQEIHQYLAEVIEAQQRKKIALVQENGRRSRFLLDLTKGLASTSSRLERSPDAINQLSTELESESEELDLERVSQVILDEIKGVGEKTGQIVENLETIGYTTVELGKLFHEADNLLLETQDSDLMDAVSGMPNRYGLMARINQVRVEVHEGQEANYSVIFIGIVDLGRVRHNWGRERFSSLIRWLGAKIKATGPYELFRTASEGLAVFSANTDQEQAMTIAQTIKETVLDQVLKQESIPKEFHFGVGVVVSKPELDEEAVILAGSERMRRSILDNGKPTV